MAFAPTPSPCPEARVAGILIVDRAPPASAVADGRSPVKRPAPFPATPPPQAAPRTPGAAARDLPSARRSAVVAALALAAAGLGCTPYVQGNGVFGEEQRTTKAFLGVQVEDGIVANVAVGTPQSVLVSGDANVVQEVATEVVPDAATGFTVLRVHMMVSQWSSVHPLRVDAVTPELRLLRASGESSVAATGVAATTFTVDGTEDAVLRLSGPGGGDLAVTLAGEHVGSLLDASAYPVATAHVDVSSRSRAELDATSQVDGTVTADASVHNADPSVCQLTDPTGAAASCAP